MILKQSFSATSLLSSSLVLKFGKEKKLISEQYPHIFNTNVSLKHTKVVKNTKVKTLATDTKVAWSYHKNRPKSTPLCFRVRAKGFSSTSRKTYDEMAAFHEGVNSN